MPAELGSGAVEYDPEKTIIHFGSPQGSTYTTPDPLVKP